MNRLLYYIIRIIQFNIQVAVKNALFYYEKIHKKYSFLNRMFKLHKKHSLFGKLFKRKVFRKNRLYVIPRFHPEQQKRT